MQKQISTSIKEQKMPKPYLWYAFIAFLLWLIIQLVSSYYVAREKAALDQVNQYQTEIDRYQRHIAQQQSEIGYYQFELQKQATLAAQQLESATPAPKQSPTETDEPLYTQADLDDQATRIVHNQQISSEGHLQTVLQGHRHRVATLEAQKFMLTDAQSRRVQAEVLAAHAQMLLDDVGPVDDLALLLARRAVLMTWLEDGYTTAHAENVLRAAIDHAAQYQTFRLTKDQGPIHSVAANSDGSEIVYSGNKGMLRVWNVTTGEFVKALHGHSGAVNAVAYRPDSRQIASAADDGNVIFWDVTDEYKLEKTLKGHAGSVNAIAYSPDGTHLVSASADHTVRLWHVETGTEKLLLEGHGDAVWAVDYHPASKYVVSGSQDTTMRIWDTDSGEMVRVMHGHTGGIRSVAFSHDGECLASASDDRTVRIWDATTGDKTWGPSYGSHRSYRRKQIYEGTRCIESEIESDVWDGLTRGQVYILHKSDDLVNSVAFLSERMEVVTSGDDRTLRIWNIQDQLEKYSVRYDPQVHPADVNTVAYNLHRNFIISGNDKGEARLWWLENIDSNGILQGEMVAYDAKFSPDGLHIVSGNASGILMTWDLQGSGARTYGTYYNVTNSIEYSPDGMYIAAGHKNKNIMVWNVENGKVAQLFSMPEEVISIAYNSTGEKLLAAIKQRGSTHPHPVEWWYEKYQDKPTKQGDILNAWSVLNNKLQIIQGQTFDINAVDYDPKPNSHFVVFGGTDQVVRVWDIESGTQAHAFEGHTGSINTVAYSPDGHYVASGSDDHSIRIWDLRSGQESFLLEGHGDKINSIAYNPDGTQLASASQDQTIRIWNLDTGRSIRLLSGHNQSVLSVSYSPDGTQIVSTGQDSTIRIWEGTVEDLLRKAEMHIERSYWPLTDAERDRFSVPDNVYWNRLPSPTPTATSDATPTTSPTLIPTRTPYQTPRPTRTLTPLPDNQSHFAKPPGLMAPIPLSTLSTPPTVSSTGWSDIYTEDFENGFFDDADCHTYAYNTQTGMPRYDYSWGRTNLNPPLPHSGTFAAWPAADTQRAPINTYPDHFYTDVVCTFTGLEEADNLMVEFWAWQDNRNEDYLFVGFNTGEEPVQLGLEMLAYRGVAWQETLAVVDGHDSPQWEKRRLYLLRDQGDLRLPDHGVVHIIWRFASPTANQAAAQGAFIDDVRIAQYRRDPGLGDRCRGPASLEQPIGKGVSLPPFVSSVYNREAGTIDPAQLPPMVENLQGVNAKWVRLEFTVPVSAYADSYSRTLINETPPTIDLEHYDLMIDALCQGGIGVLGLIDYDTFVDDSWRKSHRFSPAYLEKFVNRTLFLADYYRDRIDHWQIWNEPDLPPEGENDVPHQIEPDSYAQLLVQVYQQLRNPIINPNVDPNDRILLGGLSSVNRSDDPAWGYGYDYLAALYEAVPPQNMPFYDILALHPYPGAQASHGTNPLQNPARYLYSKGEEQETDGPTLIHKFQNLIYREGDWAGKLYQPFIWITELGWRRGREERSKIGFDCESLRPRLSYEFQQFDYLYNSLDTLFGETHWLDQGRLNLPQDKRELILTDQPSVSTVIWHEYQDSSEWLDCVPFAGNSTPDLPIMLPTWPRSFDEIWAEREVTPPDMQIVGWWWGLYNGNKKINPVGCALRDYPDSVADPECLPRDRAMLDQPIYVPRVTRGGSPYTTQIRLANLERYRATSLLQAYNETGEIVAGIDDLIPPGGTKNYYPVEDVPVGFDGALTFWTDSRVPAVINLWANDSTSGAAFVGQREASKKLYLPVLMQRHDGADSWVSIQNVGDATAQVLVEYSDGTRARSVIPVGASSLFEQALEDHSQTLFAATATSDEPVVALAVQEDPHGMAAYNGLAQGITRPALPHIRGNDGGMNSTIYLQNVGDQPTDVTIAYIADPATAGPSCQEAQSIPTGQVVPFDVTACLPDARFVGSAMVITNSAEQPLAGVVQQRSDGINNGAYSAFDPESATHAISLPWLMDRHEGYSTEISVQHVGGPDAIIRCIFGYADRELTAILSAGQSFTDSQQMLFIEGHTGPAFCMADDPDAKIVAVVQQRGEDGKHLLIYEGFIVE